METAAAQLARVRSMTSQLRADLARAGVDVNDPDQVMHALVLLCASQVRRITQKQGLETDDAVRAGVFAGRQLPRLVRQLRVVRLQKRSVRQLH